MDSSTRSIQQRLDALEPVIKRICAVAGTPGISIGISRNGQVAHRASYGLADIEAKSPATSKTVYPIGTMAKALTASAVGILVHEGKLQWNTPIREILPGFQTRSAAVTSHLNVVDLLSHRAGLARSNFWWQGVEGKLLLEKSQLLDFYSKLEPTGSFRADWAYSNWGYALVGEVIEAVSGMSYGDFMEQKLLRPLGMNDATFGSISPSDPNLAKPYSIMDDGSTHLMPLPPVHSDTIMAPAMGGRSSADDLLTYSMALLQAYKSESGRAADYGRSPVLRHALMQLSGHIFTGRSMFEKSYAFGFYRSQLPSTVLGMGWNSIYVKEMPVLVPGPGVSSGPVIAHGGSLPGYHVAMALLPELDSSVVVCTNSIALGDVSGWVSMAVLEALMETPQPSDYVKLATEAARASVGNVSRLQHTLQQQKTLDSPHKALGEYVGRYKHATMDWFIDVRLRADRQLEVVFMGLDSQAWAMEYYEADTFLWLASRGEQARRGRMTTYPLVANHFKLEFMADAQGQIDRLCWAHEVGLPLSQQCFLKASQ
ncbi:hypothetical protein ARSEF1564_007261 [Beauveria bassiana]